MKTFPIHYILLPALLLLAGCKAGPDNFTLTFTMESIGSYKASITVDSNKDYSIQQQNLFFNAQSNKEDIHTSTGKLADEEFAGLKRLISGSRLSGMKDSYGFGKEPDPGDPLNNVIYQLSYTEGGRKTKYISIRPNPDDTYPEKFPALIHFLSNYISKTMNNGQ